MRIFRHFRMFLVFIAVFSAVRWWRRAPVGSKSLLLGAHQVVLHPLFLAVAWARLYGFPRDPRLWVTFFTHDLGYWGLPNLDGPEGQRHPELGGKIMARLFGPEWGAFTRRHSRFYAQLEGAEPSPLCAADKLVLLVTPSWIYLPCVWFTGEAREYQALFARWRGVEHVSIWTWYAGLREHWASEVQRLAPGARWSRERAPREGA